MKHRLSVLTVALILAALMSITVGPAWGQEIDGCTDDDNDTPCLPTTTDDCKNGGWQEIIRHHPFKNQGECVRFVAADKTPPAG